MAYYNNFISDILRINSQSQPAQAMRQNLLALAAQDLQEQRKLLADSIQTLQAAPANGAIDGVRQRIIDTQQPQLAAIDAELERIKQVTGALDFSQKITLDKAAISEFAANFSNVRHLTKVLLDAPPSLQKVQIELYLAVIAQQASAKNNDLRKEAEQQLLLLTPENLRTLGLQAAQRYASETDGLVKDKLRLLVQSAVFSLIQQHIDDFLKIGQPHQADYQQLLHNLSSRLKGMAISDVLDDFHNYQNQQGQSLVALLAFCEQKANIDLHSAKNEVQPLLQERKALLRQLHFGQKERQLYTTALARTISNDTFILRDRYDEEIFKKTANDYYLGLISKKNIGQNFRRSFRDVQLLKSPKETKLQSDVIYVFAKDKQLSFKMYTSEGMKEGSIALADLVNDPSNTKVEDILKKLSQYKDVILRRTADFRPRIWEENIQLDNQDPQYANRKHANRKRLAEILMSLKEYRDKGEPILRGKGQPTDTVKRIIETELTKAKVECSEQGIVITFSAITSNNPSSNPSALSAFIKKITEYAGLGRTIDETFVDYINSSNGIDLQTLTINGQSLHEIQELLNEQRKVAPQNEHLFVQYQKQLDQVKLHAYFKNSPNDEKALPLIQRIEQGKSRAEVEATIAPGSNETQILKNLHCGVEDLKLNKSQESTLYKLLELAAIDSNSLAAFPTLTEELKALSDNLTKVKQGDFSKALEHADERINRIYVKLANLKAKDSSDPRLSNLIAKAQTFAKSLQKRKDNTIALHQALASEENVEAISQLITHEIQSMATKMQVPLVSTCPANIKNIVKEYAAFKHRINTGALLSAEEEEQYHDALQTIAQQLNIDSWENVAFEIPAGTNAEIVVTNGFQSSQIKISTTKARPFALHKTAGADFQLVFGKPVQGSFETNITASIVLTNRNGTFHEGDYTLPSFSQKFVEGLPLKTWDPRLNNQRELRLSYPGPEVVDYEVLVNTQDEIRNRILLLPKNAPRGEAKSLYSILVTLGTGIKTEQAKPTTETLIAKIRAVLQKIADPASLEKNVESIITLVQEIDSDYQLHQNPDYQKRLQNKITLERAQQACTSSDQFIKFHEGIRLVNIICTYPDSEEEEKKSINLLNQNLNDARFKDIFLGDLEPDLLKKCIAQGKTELVCSLLGRIDPNHQQQFFERVSNQGLLHFAVEQNQRAIFEALLSALRKSGQNEQTIKGLLFTEKRTPELHWASHCLHAAIRNNIEDLVPLLLKYLQDYEKDGKLLHEALHLSAALGQTKIYKDIHNHLSKLGHAPSIHELITLNSELEQLSPYQLLLRDSRQVDLIAWDQFEKTEAQEFLLQSKHIPALLIAVRAGNWDAVDKLLKMAQKFLKPEELYQFLLHKDDDGKNLANYLLTYQPDSYQQTVRQIHTMMGNHAPNLLMELLNNPAPNNPIAQFLQQSHPDHYTIFNQILASIDNQQQSAGTTPVTTWRAACLLSNSSWLIEQANEPKCQVPLRKFFGDAPLTAGVLKLIVDELTNQTIATQQTAKNFLQTLSSEFAQKSSAKENEEARLAMPQVRTMVAQQRNELPQLLSVFDDERTQLQQKIKQQERYIGRLTKDHQEELERINKIKIGLESITQLSQDQIEVLSADNKKLREYSQRKRTDNQNLRAQLKQNESTIKSLQHDIQENNSTIADITSKLEESQKQLSDANISRQQLQNELQINQQTNASLTETINENQKNIAFIEGNLRSLRGELNALQEKYNQSIAENRRQTKVIGTLEEEKKRVQNESEHYKTQLKKRTEESENLVKANNNLKQELKTTSATLNKVRQEKERVDAEIITLQNNIKDLNQQSTQLSQKKELLETEITTQKELFATEKSQLSSEITALKQTQNEREAELLKLTKNLAEKEEQGNELSLQIQELQRTLTAAELNLTQEKTKFTDTVNQLQKQITDITSAHSSAQENVTQLQNSLQQEQDKAQNLQNSIEQTKNELKSQLNNQEANFAVEKENLSTQISELKQKQTANEEQIENLNIELATEKNKATKVQTELETAHKKLEAETENWSEKEKEHSLKISDLQSQITALQQGQDTVVQEKDKLQQLLKSQKQQLIELQQQLESQKIELQAKNQEITEQQTVWGDQKSEFIQQNRNLQIANEQMQTKLTELESSLSEQEQTAHQNEAELQKLRKELEEQEKSLLEQRHSFTQEKAILETKISNIESERSAAQEKATHLEQSLQDQQQQTNALQEKITQMQTELDTQDGLAKSEKNRLQQEVDTLKISTERLHKENEEISATLNSALGSVVLEEPSGSPQNSIDEVQNTETPPRSIAAQLEVLKKKIEQSNQEKNQLKDRLSTTNTTLSSKEKEIQEQAKVIAQYYNNLNLLQQNLNQLTQQNAELKKEVDEYSTTTQNLTETLQQLEQANNTQKDTIAEKTEKLSEQENALNVIKKDLEDTMQEVTTLKEELETEKTKAIEERETAQKTQDNLTRKEQELTETNEQFIKLQEESEETKILNQRQTQRLQELSSDLTALQKTLEEKIKEIELRSQEVSQKNLEIEQTGKELQKESAKSLQFEEQLRQKDLDQVFVVNQIKVKLDELMQEIIALKNVQTQILAEQEDEEEGYSEDDIGAEDESTEEVLVTPHTPNSNGSGTTSTTISPTTSIHSVQDEQGSDDSNQARWDNSADEGSSSPLSPGNSDDSDDENQNTKPGLQRNIRDSKFSPSFSRQNIHTDSESDAGTEVKGKMPRRAQYQTDFELTVIDDFGNPLPGKPKIVKLLDTDTDTIQSSIEETSDESLISKQRAKTPSNNSIIPVQTTTNTTIVPPGNVNTIPIIPPTVPQTGNSPTTTTTVNQQAAADAAAAALAAQIAEEDKLARILKNLIARSKNLPYLQQINTAATMDDITLNPARLDYSKIKNPAVLKELATAAEDRIKKVLAARNVKKEAYLGLDCQAMITQAQDEYKEWQDYLQKITQVDKKTKKELADLAKTDVMDWLSPVFQAQLTEKLAENHSKYRQLANHCDALVFHLSSVQDELDDQLASIPTAQEIRAVAVDNFKDLAAQQLIFHKQLENTKKELALHEPLQEKLHGNAQAQHPLLKNGILKTFEQAKNNEGSVKFLGFTTKVIRHDLADKEKVLAKHKNAHNPLASDVLGELSLPADPDSPGYKLVEREASGYFREVIINPDTEAEGSFIIDYETQPDTNKKRVKLSINMFPKFADPESPEAIAASVEFAIAFASQALAERSTVPSAKEPLLIKSFDKHILRYIVTALLIIGRESPQTRFDQNAIRVKGAIYDINKEFNGRRGFSDDSYYHKYFMKEKGMLPSFLSGLQELGNDKFGRAKMNAKIGALVDKVNEKFTTNSSTLLFKQGLNKLREEEPEKAPSPHNLRGR